MQIIGQFRSLHSPAQPSSTAIHGYPQNPGSQGPLGIPAPQAAKYPQEGFLRHVLGVLPVDQNPKTEAENFGLELLDESPHRVGMPFQAPANHGGIVGSHGGPFTRTTPSAGAEFHTSYFAGPPMKIVEFPEPVGHVTCSNPRLAHKIRVDRFSIRRSVGVGRGGRSESFQFSVTSNEGNAMKAWITCLTVGIVASAGLAQEKPLAWPQFRGPGATGVAEDQKPPTEFGPDKNVKWKIDVPSGSSSPIVVGEMLVLTAFDGGKLYTIAYNRADGKELWRAHAPAKEIEGYHKTEGSPAASTPATDGERIVSYFGSCGLFCYDLAGKELWKYEMPAAVTVGDFGTGVSPVLVDGTVVLLRDETKEPKLLAVDAATGTKKWETKRQSPSGFGTPAVWDGPDGKQIVTVGFQRLVGYDLKSGDEKWAVLGMPAACCTTPVVSGGNLFFAGWSPGDPEEKTFQMPKFDELLKMAGEEKLGHLTKEGAEKTPFKGFFSSLDTNKDGKVTRDEFEAVMKMMATSRNSAFALKPGGSGDITKSHVLWKKAKGLPYVPSAIVYKGQYVLVKDGGLVTVYDAKTGEDVYVQERAVSAGRYYASPVAANGNIYFTSLDDGTITVLKGGTDKPEVVAKNPKLGERTAATPAIADDTLYVRTEKHMYAFAVKK
jgi:outer membrane protein assembly factor BamB